MNTIQTLRPGLLVSLSTSVRGNTTYRTLTIEGRRIDDLGQERARWETTRVVSDPAEQEEAIRVRSRVRSLITGVCSSSAFGLLCPEVNADKLKEAIAAARELTDDFNSRATVTRMHVNVICGRIAADDVEAVKAITGEVRSLLEDMQQGLKSLDVKAVRDACNKAREVGAMLTPDAQGKLTEAIAAARSSARQIVKAGEVIGLEIDQAAIDRIDSARTSFLDLDTDAATVATPEMDGRAMDLDSAPADPVAADDEDVPLTDDEYFGINSAGETGVDYGPDPITGEVPLTDAQRENAAYESAVMPARQIDWSF